MTLSGERLLAFLISVSFAAGLNVYATVAAVGILGHFSIVTLPAALQVLADPWVIAGASVLFAVEFIADKVPVFDLLWNAMQTFVRVPAAALLSYAGTSDLAPQWQIAAAVAGGLIALAAHGGKTAARAAITPSPEPVSNFVLSTAEDAFVIFLTWLAAHHPVVAAGIVLILTAVIVLLMRAVVRAFRAMFRRSRG